MLKIKCSPKLNAYSNVGLVSSETFKTDITSTISKCTVSTFRCFPNIWTIARLESSADHLPQR